MSFVLRVFLGLILAFAPRQSLASSPADLCIAAAHTAAARTSVPLRVLLAVTLTETGRSAGQALKPWAWALNRGGESLWFETGDETRRYLQRALAEGTSNIDVGCFQLNWRWHGQEFASLEAMLDPESNALYAARYLERLYAESGDWTRAAGAYHSADPGFVRKYLARWSPIYAGLEGLEDSLPVYSSAVSPLPRENRFPLLRAGASASPGSLVPMISGAAMPLFGG